MNEIAASMFLFCRMHRVVLLVHRVANGHCARANAILAAGIAPSDRGVEGLSGATTGAAPTAGPACARTGQGIYICKYLYNYTAAQQDQRIEEPNQAIVTSLRIPSGFCCIGSRLLPVATASTPSIAAR